RPKPCPNNTTLVPTGPWTGSTCTVGISFNETALLTVCCTGAQQEPSGRGSEEARRTAISPEAALAGTSTSILSSFQRRGLTTRLPTTTSLTPNIVLGSRGPAVMPKCSPRISIVWPGSIEGG